MEDDWDLYAVVRGYVLSSSASTTARNAVDSPGFSEMETLAPEAMASPERCFLVIGEEEDGCGSILSELGNDVEELHELYKPFLRQCHETPLSSPQVTFFNPSSSSPMASSCMENSNTSRKQQQSKQSHLHCLNIHRSKRKNQSKKVCQVSANDLSSDFWAWRKYGQKPIKGSPYPRGYYRCSSSKSCLARKQVERNKLDPDMFIVTYTAEHNHPPPTHRNSLQGSTRQKSSTQASAIAAVTGQPVADNPASGESLAANSAQRPCFNAEKAENVPDMENGEVEAAGFSEKASYIEPFARMEDLVVVAANSISDSTGRKESRRTSVLSEPDHMCG